MFLNSAHVMNVLPLIIAVIYLQETTTQLIENPTFSEPIANVTVAAGRDTILKCSVEDLGPYKVAWLRIDTQTILTIQHHVITKNHRISVTHSEHKTWFLHLKNVRQADRGWYMCQINTDPMQSQMGYLDVVVPPDILDYPTSTDIIVDEGSDVSLRCVASGSPEPNISWKREDGEFISLDGESVSSFEGPTLNLSKVNRKQMGPYLCIASNGVPPTVSKRIMLIVHFPPVIWIHYQLIGAFDGQQIILECDSEAYPKSINYWIRDKGDIVPHNEKYEPIATQKNYKVHMKLIIRNIEMSDYGLYKCISKNSIGETDGTVNVYRLPKQSFSRKSSHNRTKSAVIDETSKINDVTYQIGSTYTDRANPLFLEDQHRNIAGEMKLPKTLMYVMLFSCLASIL